jgi:hypothetical protein
VSWKSLSQNAAGTDHFTALEGIALDGAGNIYVSDYASLPPPTGSIARIVKTDITGSTWTVLGGASGSGTGQFFCPGQPHCTNDRHGRRRLDHALDQVRRR